MTKYKKSEELLERALKTIPLGSQTFSKSITQLPHGISPYFATHAKGSKFWDVDGNEYLDFNNGLLSITLGHCDPDVVNAVKQQLEKGTIFSLASELEVELGEKIRDMVPCAEMVRYGKNGSDATAGAIRLARAITKRDHVLVCGYHGWQDWYIAVTTKNRGIPGATSKLTHSFTYNNIDSLNDLLNEYKDEVAAVIMEPVNVTCPHDGFLESVKELTHQHGALLIYDETITGFRYSNGGAQEFFGVTPDLATFGKGLANGYPLSAVTGKAEYMKELEDLFFSFTFGGETLSLAASLAVLNKLTNEPVVDHMSAIGDSIIKKGKELIRRHALADAFDIAGYGVWSFMMIQDFAGATSFEWKSLYMQEMFKRGIFTLGTHNISYAHSEDDVSRLMTAYDEFFGLVNEVKAAGNMDKVLECEPLKPLFKVR